MSYPRLSPGEIYRRGQELYEKRIRAAVESDENVGKMVSIDIDTGEYEVDETGLEGSRRLQERHPDAAIYGARIGYDAAYSFGGGLNRTNGR